MVARLLIGLDDLFVHLQRLRVQLLGLLRRLVRVALRLLQRLLELDMHLDELLLFLPARHDVLLQKLSLCLHLAQHLRELLVALLLLLDAPLVPLRLGLERHDLLALFPQRLLGGLQRLVALCHSNQRALPLLQQLLLLEVNRFHLLPSLRQRLLCRLGLLLLRRGLRIIQRQGLVQILERLLQTVNEHILTLFLALKLGNRLLGDVRGAPGHRNLALHLFVVRFNLFEGAVELVKLELVPFYTSTLFIGIHRLGLVPNLELLQVCLSLLAHLGHNVIIVVRFFQAHLQLCELLLHRV
mmetsp:Transcript_2703/g.4309  ORF Transcript_2703/g.4309 Transcript_2703/m.4309 type:complete len:298 (+) Transcript_2703:2079-2972(+)